MCAEAEPLWSDVRRLRPDIAEVDCVIGLGASARHTTFPDVTGSRSSRSRPVVPELLEQIGFTDHALTRFASRAGMATSSRAVVEPIVRDLLLQEGLVVGARPHWAHSRDTADLYLQLGEWMLFIGCRRNSLARRTRS